MTPYLFQSQDFALSDTGVHLLRNKFNYKTIPYEEVPMFSIQAGNPSYKLRLREVYKSNRVAEFRKCLDKQLGARVPIEDSLT